MESNAIALAIAHKSVKFEYPYLVLNHRGNPFSFSPLIMMLAVGFSHMGFITLRFRCSHLGFESCLWIFMCYNNQMKFLQVELLGQINYLFLIILIKEVRISRNLFFVVLEVGSLRPGHNCGWVRGRASCGL
nr:uncharacterized protein LOC105726705 [Aotus nancymaae]